MTHRAIIGPAFRRDGGYGCAPAICRHATWLLVAFLVVSGATVRGGVAQWDFDFDLDSTTGHDPLEEWALMLSEFEEMEIGGEVAAVLHFQRGTYFRVRPGLPPNGGGDYINQYTLIMDVMFPDRSPSSGWAALHQTRCGPIQP